MATIVRAINRTRGTVLCERLEQAATSRERSRGLLGRRGLEPGAGMLFVAGRLTPFLWMHMFFMRFAIDIVFLGRDGRVLKIDHRLRPWRVSSLVFGAYHALELAEGSAERSQTQIGDQIIIEPV
ncbi:MAG: DUF192 domain-containing protein [Candidatus Binataceae bacterium]|jgi:uncharacterized membrane protein (UPF0127 family)